ncbi:MAG: butyrate kinase [Acetobacteraceae bacterium]|nr:butyrate kinase [Acetobacteraceae bacterium]
MVRLAGDCLVAAVNPGATSTKLGLFCGQDPVFQETLRHPEGELARFTRVAEQREYRLEQVVNALRRRGLKMEQGEVQAVAGRGGLLKPLPGGTYTVNRRMVEDLTRFSRWEHASNLGGLLALDLAERWGCPAFVVDPVSVDELEPVARLSGLPGVDRVSLSHALNSRAVARRVAAELGRRYEEVSLVVAHLGSGISVGAHRDGRMVDVNNPNEEGPFGPERAGGLPVAGVLRLAWEGFLRGETLEQVSGVFSRRGGAFAYLGTRDMAEAEARARAGDAQARLVLEAMAYQVAKEIGAMAAALCGRVDRVVITGGIANSEYLVGLIRRRVGFIAPVAVVPGEEELLALAQGALRVLRGEEPAKEYV